MMHFQDDDADTLRSHIVTVARLIIDYRDNARSVEERLNAHARRMGLDFDRRADAAGGASGAYGIAAAALAGAMGAPSIEDIAGNPREWRDPGMARPVLPGELFNAAVNVIAREGEE